MPTSIRLLGRSASTIKQVRATISHKRTDTAGSLSQSSSETTLSESSSEEDKSVDDEKPLVLSLNMTEIQLPPMDTHDREASNLPLQSQMSSTLTNGSNVKGDPMASLARKPSTDHNLRALPTLRVSDPRMMHQTSSKLLRMTRDDRPFTKDVKDLFATLIVSLPLTTHRVRFSKVEHTFTTEEAIINLGSLKFSQSNRMPDPRDPSRIVTTTTTTTFSMAKEMARSVCLRFLEARLVESLEGKSDFTSAKAVWQLTPKGMHILARFCQRNGIHQRHVNELLDSPRNNMQLVLLERDSRADRLVHDAPMIYVLFRRFAGDAGPNIKSHSASSDSDSVQDYTAGLAGVRLQRARRPEKDTAPYTFTGKAALDWLMDCCTVMNKAEADELANSFLEHGLTEAASEDRSAHSVGERPRFSASKNAIYAITKRGMSVAGWTSITNANTETENSTTARSPIGSSRDSNTNRMTVIVRDLALRMLFREYLRETHCEENLSFYTEVQAFLADYEMAKQASDPPSSDVVRETLASAYSLYNAFLAPGSPCELNIDHSLRNALAARMTRAVGENEGMLDSLNEVATLFDKAQTSVFKLMASDSVPKFSREPRYAAVLRERNLEGMMTALAAL